MPAADDIDEPPPSRRSGSLRTVAVGLVAVVLLLGGILAAALLRSDATPPTETSGLGEPVPFAERTPADVSAPLPVRTLAAFGDGQPIDLAAYRGRPLVVNFWATWCAPCVEEMPGFNRVAEDLAGRVAFVGVDTRDAPREAEAFVAELGITYDLAADPSAALFGEVEAFGMPTTLFVDPEGTIVFRHTGPLTTSQLRDTITEHLGTET